MHRVRCIKLNMQKPVTLYIVNYVVMTVCRASGSNHVVILHIV